MRAPARKSSATWSLIFSTAPAPPAVAGALAALDLIQEHPQRVQRLQSNARVLRRALAAEGFPVADSEMHIVPLIVGDERAAMRMCQEAIGRGAFAQAIRPPTVPMGTSRLRLTAMASHTSSELQLAASVFGDAARKLGLDPAAMAPPLPERRPVMTELAQLEQAEVTAFTHERFEEPSTAPFDLEQDRDRPRIGTQALSAPQAPFDFEREISGARAA